MKQNELITITRNAFQRASLKEAVANGSIIGGSTVKKFGYNPLVGTGLESVWDEGGLIPYVDDDGPAVVFTLSSTDANDTLLGTGARTVQFIGLDENYDQVTDIIELDGQNPVNFPIALRRLFRMIVLTGGIAGGAIGNIRAGTGEVVGGVPDVTYARISAGINQTLMCVYTVPRNHVIWLSEYYTNVGKGKEGTVFSYARTPGSVFQVKRVVNLYESTFVVDNNIPFVFDEKTDLEVRATTGTPSAAIAAGFDMMLFNKETARFTY